MGGAGVTLVSFCSLSESFNTALLEYFAGEKPLRMSQISRKVYPL